MIFYKYHGLGNDFIIIDEYEVNENYSVLAKRVCHRNTGIGADGLIISKKNDENYEMVFYNTDGSRAKMCGNGIRCYAKYLVDQGYESDDEFSIDTLAGVMHIDIKSRNPFEVEINMGVPSFNTDNFSIDVDSKEYLAQTLEVNDELHNISSILMGVEHTVEFVETLDVPYMLEIGSLLEVHPIYPNRTNVNFVRKISNNEIEMQTFERGVGLTYACGTGACASVVVGVELGYLEREVLVRLPLGNLSVSVRNQEVFMNGPAEFICKGEYL